VTKNNFTEINFKKPCINLRGFFISGTNFSMSRYHIKAIIKIFERIRK